MLKEAQDFLLSSCLLHPPPSPISWRWQAAHDTQREEDQERGKLGYVIAGGGREGSEPTRTTAKISLVDPE
jgi:hypothetical protein